MRRNIAVFFLIFALALAIRLFFLLQIKDDPLLNVPILDAKVYLKWAESILSRQQQKAFFTEPGYAYILALFLKLFKGNYFPLIILQIILGSLTPVLIYFSLQKLFKSFYLALIVSIFSAFLKPAIFFDLLLLKTSLEIFLFSVIAFFSVSFWHKKEKIKYLILGLLIGLTALIKANIFYTLPFLILAIIWPLKTINKERIILSFMLFFGSLFAIVPVIYHNFHADRSLVLISWSAGPNFYIGNWLEADGSFKPPEYISLDPEKEEESWKKATEMYLGKKVKAGEINNFWLKKGLVTILKNPGNFLRLTFRKMALFISRAQITDNYRYEYVYLLCPWLKYAFDFYLLAVPGLLGLFLSFFDKDFKEKLAPLQIICLTYSGFLLFFHINERYRLALYPFLAIFSAYLILWFKENLYSLKALIFLIVITIIFLLSFVLKVKMSLADTTNSFASEYLYQKKKEKALEYFNKGLFYDSQHLPSKKNLARLYLLEKDFDQAIKIYREILQINPAEESRLLSLSLKAKKEDWDEAKIKKEMEVLGNEEILEADYFEGMSLFRLGKITLAQNLLEKVYQRQPDFVPLLSNLAVIYKNFGDFAKAEELYLKALAKEPDNLVVNYNLAKEYFLRNKYIEALPLLERINTIMPDYLLTSFFLGVSYFQTGNERGALLFLTDFVKKNQNQPAREKEIKQANYILRLILKKLN